jgi:flagellar basal-body rod modification protein FlgD
MPADSVNSVSKTSATFGATDNPSARIPTKTLGQQDFLTLLVAQMKSQDPMNPQKDSDFIAQMAQFNTLEQTKTMQSDISGLRNDQQLARAGALLGQTVTVQADSGSAPVTGVVTSVQTTSAGAKIVVNNTAYTLDQISQISVPAGNSVVPTGS